MSVERISERIKASCKDDPEMEELLLELFQFELEGRGWYKDKYRDIIKKHAKEIGRK